MKQSPKPDTPTLGESPKKFPQKFPQKNHGETRTYVQNHHFGGLGGHVYIRSIYRGHNQIDAVRHESSRHVLSPSYSLFPQTRTLALSCLAAPERPSLAASLGSSRRGALTAASVPIHSKGEVPHAA